MENAVGAILVAIVLLLFFYIAARVITLGVMKSLSIRHKTTSTTERGN